MVAIFGKNTNLTKSLLANLDSSECKVISAIDILQGNVDWLQLSHSTFVLNNFFSSSQLKNIHESNLVSLVDYSVRSTALILEAIVSFDLTVDKIIYTSSASVYGSDEDFPRIGSKKTYSLLKKLNEDLVSQFCLNHGIDYTLARVFNIFGGNDQFSVISKLIKREPNEEFVLLNNGASKRDYIHVDDVAHAIKNLVGVTNMPELDIGTGTAASMSQIIKFLGSIGSPIKIVNANTDAQIGASVADTSRLLGFIGKDYNFKSVYDYLHAELIK